MCVCSWDAQCVLSIAKISWIICCIVEMDNNNNINNNNVQQVFLLRQERKTKIKPNHRGISVGPRHEFECLTQNKLSHYHT